MVSEHEQMAAQQLQWARQVVHADDAAPPVLRRIGGLDVHWTDDFRGASMCSAFHRHHRVCYQLSAPTLLTMGGHWRWPALPGQVPVVDSVSLARVQPKRLQNVCRTCTIRLWQRVQPRAVEAAHPRCTPCPPLTLLRCTGAACLLLAA